MCTATGVAGDAKVEARSEGAAGEDEKGGDGSRRRATTVATVSSSSSGGKGGGGGGGRRNSSFALQPSNASAQPPMRARLRRDDSAAFRAGRAAGWEGLGDFQGVADMGLDLGEAAVLGRMVVYRQKRFALANLSLIDVLFPYPSIPL